MEATVSMSFRAALSLSANDTSILPRVHITEGGTTVRVGPSAKDVWFWGEVGEKPLDTRFKGEIHVYGAEAQQQWSSTESTSKLREKVRYGWKDTETKFLGFLLVDVSRKLHGYVDDRGHIHDKHGRNRDDDRNFKKKFLLAPVDVVIDEQSTIINVEMIYSQWAKDPNRIIFPYWEIGARGDFDLGGGKRTVRVADLVFETPQMTDETQFDLWAKGHAVKTPVGSLVTGANLNFRGSDKTFAAKPGVGYTDPWGIGEVMFEYEFRQNPGLNAKGYIITFSGNAFLQQGKRLLNGGSSGVAPINPVPKASATNAPAAAPASFVPANSKAGNGGNGGQPKKTAIKYYD